MIVYAIVVGGMPASRQRSSATRGTRTSAPSAWTPPAPVQGGHPAGAFIAGMLILYTFYVTWPRGDVGMKRRAEPFETGTYVKGVRHQPCAAASCR